MRIEISVRDFDPWVRDAYKKFFAGDHNKSPASLEWRFTSNPHGRAKFVTVEVDGEPAGMIALIPTKLANSPGCSFGYQAIDVVVDSRYQGRGLFVRMGAIAHEAHGHGAALVWGFPNANAAPGWFGRLNWSNLGVVPLLIRPLRSGYLLGRLHSRLRKIDLPLIRHRQSLGSIYTDGELLASDVGELWTRVRSTYGIAVDRTAHWLRWRLIDKPVCDYRCVGAQAPNGELVAFVATKIAHKHGAEICYVMEALCAGSDGPLLSRLLNSELTHALDSGAEVALAWCPPSAPNYRAYRRAGFLPVPARARPIEINFGARALQDCCAAASAPGARWYISYLDSDTN